MGSYTADRLRKENDRLLAINADLLNSCKCAITYLSERSLGEAAKMLETHLSNSVANAENNV